MEEIATNQDAREPAVAPPFSLKDYASMYTGNTLVQRLLAILRKGSLCSSFETAPFLVSVLVEKTLQTSLYFELFSNYSFLGSFSFHLLSYFFHIMMNGKELLFVLLFLSFILRDSSRQSQ